MSDDLGKLILRLTVGLLMLMHGLAKIMGGVSGIGGMLQRVGLPDELAWGAYIGEVLAPVLVILGFYARIGAALMVANMLFAIGLAHMKDLFALTPSGAWALELQGFFLACSLVVALIGPGRYSINRR